MKVFRGIETIGKPFRHPVMTIGNFDGIHIGHRQVIGNVVERAREKDGTSVVLIFDPHPRSFFSPDSPVRMITTIEQRIELLETMGVDVLIIQTFDETFAKISAEDFISKFLVGKVGISELHVSTKFRFGYGAAGNPELLQEFSEKYDITLAFIDNIYFRHTFVSSSFIRQAVSDGEMEIVRLMMGRPFTMYGAVYSDTQRGTNLLGTPTSNIRPENDLIPAKGIYAGAVSLPEGRYPAATYIGNRPTFEGGELVVESHILGFQGSLYGQRIGIELFKKTRNDRKFTHLNDLLHQIKRDIEVVRDYLQKHVDDPQLGNLIWNDQ